ncbi:MAG: sugar phosphate isomerase/epimerase [Bacteroidetes bacterium]|nr:sugar phosphate isomerase/epimerase [Bacteroidota bacterium]
MRTSRRNFIKTGALAVTGATMLSNKLFAERLSSSAKLTGLQLYTVRDAMAKAPLDTLKKVASIGYKHVEHASYVNRKFYGYPAAEFKKVIDGLGLKMVSGHTVLGPWHWDKAKNDFTDVWKYTVDDAAALGQQYVISPWLDESLRKDYDGLLKWMEIFNKSGELCKKSGMKFGYHNHDFEFSTTINNMKLYDVIMQQTDPALVAQQMDIGNMYGAGGHAIDLINQYPGRYELMHVKDEIKAAGKGEMEGGYESTVLGKGVMDVKKILDAAAAKGGTTHFIIEQESYQAISPIEAAKEDLAAMNKWGY